MADSGFQSFSRRKMRPNAIKGKPLTFTLVSDQGASETTSVAAIAVTLAHRAMLGAVCSASSGAGASANGPRDRRSEDAANGRPAHAFFTSRTTGQRKADRLQLPRCRILVIGPPLSTRRVSMAAVFNARSAHAVPPVDWRFGGEAVCWLAVAVPLVSNKRGDDPYDYRRRRCAPRCNIPPHGA